MTTWPLLDPLIDLFLSFSLWLADGFCCLSLYLAFASVDDVGDPNLQLLFTNQYDIQRIDLQSQSLDKVVVNLSSAMAVDYHYRLHVDDMLLLSSIHGYCILYSFLLYQTWPDLLDRCCQGCHYECRNEWHQQEGCYWRAKSTRSLHVLHVECFYVVFFLMN